MFQNTGTGVPVFNLIRGGLAVMYAFFRTTVQFWQMIDGTRSR